ncbi:45520_t:CDS:2, partial [Gigaspora margarita]
NLNTILNYLEHHINNNHSTMLTALRNRVGLLTNDLLNNGVNVMMNVLFLNTSRRSRSVTPSNKPRDNYKFELYKDRLNLLLAYFKNKKFPFVQQRSHDVPILFTKYERSITSANLCANYAAHK